ncbi:ribokinase [Actinophytocola oryzae]|uniref:Ribokinase n=1 Tax=Actinophytocola oryzae TaxID=502181 RepID=A0A4V3FSK7_9PSEU|nr:ribokinase [Actinophytocola oryzae]TDV47811.1 ribokinase [Actinophytocola oryzae]
MSVLVVGSGNVDLVSRVERIPAPGETVLSTGFATHAGGKGNNQATAAARANAHTTFLGSFGDDDNGRRLLTSLTDSGVRPLVRTSTEPTGTALITVAAGGENAIVVNAGANATLTDLTDAERTAVAEADVVLLQLEIPLATVTEAAKAATGTVVLNAAPARPLPRDLLESVDLLIVNEHEAAQLGGAEALLDVVPRLVVTLGAQGAVIHTGDTRTEVPGIPVQVVDTTGAGDTFCGALVARLDEGAALEPSVRFATTAAAVSVGRAGAVPAIPTREEIDDFHR